MVFFAGLPEEGDSHFGATKLPADTRYKYKSAAVRLCQRFKQPIDIIEVIIDRR